MKHLLDELLSKFQNKKRKRRWPKPKICLHETQRDNFKCKRKQLKINVSGAKYFDFFWKYKQVIYIWIFPIVILILTFVLFGPLFSVQNIQIFRNDNITEMNLAYSSVDNIREKRIINLDEENIKTRIKEYQNNIKDIDISFNLPDTIKIHLSSYPIYFNTIINDKTYYVTQNGTLVPWKHREEFKNLTIKKEFSKGTLPDYTKQFHTKHIENIYNAYNFLEENVIDIKVKEIHYYPKEKEVHFKLDNDVLLIYTLWRNLKEQIEKTVIYSTEHNSLSDNSIVYIDFRVREQTWNNKKEKIFYCTKQTEYQCKQNIKKIYSLYE